MSVISKGTIARGTAGLAGVLVLLLAPWIFGSSPYQLSQLEYILALILVCIGLNIATGFSGQLTLGPGATFGIAAYAAAIFANELPGNASLLVLCLIGIGVGAVFGLIVGIPALRVRGFYLAIVTLFIALALPEIASGLSVTGETQGISLLSNPTFTESCSGISLYEIIAVIVVAVLAATWAMLHSRLGRKLLTLKSSEELAQSLGHTLYRAKLLAFVLSSLPGGLAGALYVYSQQLVTPATFSANLSIYLVAACVIGGFGTIWGPVIGGALVFGVQLNTGSLNQYQGVIFGGLLIVFAIGAPAGLIGLGKLGLARFRSSRRAAPTAPRSVQPVGAVATAQLTLPPVKPSGELTVEGATCQFGGVVALAGASLTASAGQVHALIGSNGSGKTTLLNAVCGYVPLAAGTVRLGDVRLDALDPSAVARGRVARTFQTPKLVESLSVLDNVVAAAERAERVSSLESALRLPRGLRADRRARSTALACLAVLGIADLAGAPVALVPHGQRRLIEVARCLASPAQFVLLDEPAAGLSPAERGVLSEGIRALTRRGSGVVLIEHDTSFVFGLADMVTVLHRGKVLAAGAADEVQSHPDVVHAYLGEVAAAGDPEPLGVGEENA
jgi:branched-chain amino acid transport system permease protein